eukprot:1920059-Prymnesium_polylepis.1
MTPSSIPLSYTSCGGITLRKKSALLCVGVIATQMSTLERCAYMSDLRIVLFPVLRRPWISVIEPSGSVLGSKRSSLSFILLLAAPEYSTRCAWRARAWLLLQSPRRAVGRTPCTATQLARAALAGGAEGQQRASRPRPQSCP